MKITLILVSMVLVLVSWQTALTEVKEPDGFKNAKFKMSFNEAKEAGIIADVKGYLLDGQMMFTGKDETIGDIPVRVTYFFTSKYCKKDGNYTECIDSDLRLGGILISINSGDNASTVANTLKSKYGSPEVKDMENVYEKRIGLRLSWSIGNVNIMFTMNYVKPSYTLLYSYTPLLRDSIEQKREKEKGMKGDL